MMIIKNMKRSSLKSLDQELIVDISSIKPYIKFMRKILLKIPVKILKNIFDICTNSIFNIVSNTLYFSKLHNVRKQWYFFY